MKIFIVIMGSLLSIAAWADEPIANPGCRDFKNLVALARIQQMTEGETKAEMTQIRQAMRTLCRGRKLPKGSTVYYANGTRATDDWGEVGGWWYYPNGQRATDDAGEIGGWWYYPNGQRATDDAGEVGGWYYYPNGQRATDDAGEVGGWWYYPNGQRATDDAGEVNGWWYKSDGSRWRDQYIIHTKEELLDGFGMMRWLVRQAGHLRD